MFAYLPPVNYLVEGPTDRIVAARILEYVGLPVGKSFGERGKPHLLNVLPGYNAAAALAPWLVLVDLDQSPDCAPDFLKEFLPRPSAWMRCRVAVHAVEAWLLADAERLASFLHVPLSRFPDNPDDEPNPKVTLVNVARQSRRKAIRDDMVPREGSGRSVGVGYVSRIIEFVTASEYQWRPEVAAQHSDSLQRCIDALETLKDWKPDHEPC